ncbi:MAG: phosphoserine phosphatase SerB [Epsilonproteobacteria bacterium]|nr:phosphoserine phosphatase SerB [Campylobacterota bacterium]MBD3839305.1 phosphoserine phosphatase SerB [Campylobacterota bacterium]
MKLVVFDFDSTLMDGETIDFLAKPLGLESKVAKITEKAMTGELDFFDALQERVALLRGLDVNIVDEICQNLPLMEGALDTISGLKAKGYRVICFSGGFRNATSPASKILGIDADFSNILHQKDGILTGLVGGDMMWGSSKGDMLTRLQSLLNISPDETMVVGDGANDLSMFAHASLRVAFCAKEVLKAEASHIIDKKDLREILKIVD